MLKAIQLLGSSSGFVAYRWKPHGCNGSMSFSINPLSCSTPKTTPTKPPQLLPRSSPSKACSLRVTRFQSTRSESKMDGTSPSSSSSSVTVQSAGNVRNIKFCQLCGGPTKDEIPDGEEKIRAICTICGRIAYQNPKMSKKTLDIRHRGECLNYIPLPYGNQPKNLRSVVGCLIEHDNKVLLCKRNIQPSYGLWTLPAGYLEIGESAAEGAMRETWEEAHAEVEVVSPFAQLDIPLIGQTYVIFLAKLKKPHFSPGPESLECQLFSLDDIPFDSLAFSSILVTLKLYAEDVKTGNVKFHYGIIKKRPGSSPSDIRAYSLDHHLQS